MDLIKPDIENYCLKHTTPLPEIFTQLRDETYRNTEMPQMQVGPMEGSFLKLLIHLIQPKLVIELGTFTGFSSLAMAQALPENGKIITCDIDPESTSIAKTFWHQSPHGKKIELRLGPALSTLESIPRPIDMVFIDADKVNYSHYWEALVPKVRAGGLIIVDNVLWSGRVLAPQDVTDHEICAFNQRAKEDPRVEILMLPIRDGILLARKLDFSQSNQ